jgi:hypothetical protein
MADYDDLNNFSNIDQMQLNQMAFAQSFSMSQAAIAKRDAQDWMSYAKGLEFERDQLRIENEILNKKVSTYQEKQIYDLLHKNALPNEFIEKTNRKINEGIADLKQQSGVTKGLQDLYDGLVSEVLEHGLVQLKSFDADLSFQVFNKGYQNFMDGEDNKYKTHRHTEKQSEPSIKLEDTNSSIIKNKGP